MTSKVLFFLQKFLIFLQFDLRLGNSFILLLNIIICMNIFLHTLRPLMFFIA